MAYPYRQFFQFPDGSGAGVEVQRYQRDDLLLSAENPDPSQYSPLALDIARAIIRVRALHTHPDTPIGADGLATSLAREGSDVYLAKCIGLGATDEPLAYGRTQEYTPTALNIIDLETTEPEMGARRCRAATAAIVMLALHLNPQHELIFAHSRKNAPETRSYAFFAHHLGMSPTVGPRLWGRPGAQMFGRRSDMLKTIENTYMWDVSDLQE